MKGRNLVSDKAAVVLAISRGCLKPVQTLLKSIDYNNQDMKFELFFLYIDIDRKERQLYQSITENYGYDCFFIEVKVDYLPENELEHITKETFLRLFIPSLLPKRLNRVLYLDIDIVVNGSLRHLYEMPFHGCSIIAAEVCKNQKECIDVKRANRVPRNFKYFNAGVLMMNLPALRADEHFKSAFIVDFLRNNLKDIREDDQGYLNHFLWNKARILNCYRYNYDAGIYFCYENRIDKRLKYMLDMLRREKLANNNAIIIHYRGPNKPWRDNYDGKCLKKFMFYEQMAGFPKRQSAVYMNWVLKTKKMIKLIVKGK